MTIEKEFLALKQIVNFITKKYNLPQHTKQYVVIETIKSYANNPANGLAFYLNQYLMAVRVPSTPSLNLKDDVMKAINKYQPNNIYTTFINFLKRLGVWKQYVQALKTKKYLNPNKTFCSCGMYNIIDTSLWWSKTQEGFDFWHTIDEKWRQVCNSKTPSQTYRNKLKELIGKYTQYTIEPSEL